jgi:hypothetical protein
MKNMSRLPSINSTVTRTNGLTESTSVSTCRTLSSVASALLSAIEHDSGRVKSLVHVLHTPSHHSTQFGDHFAHFGHTSANRSSDFLGTRSIVGLALSNLTLPTIVGVGWIVSTPCATTAFLIGRRALGVFHRPVPAS